MLHLRPSQGPFPRIQPSPSRMDGAVHVPQQPLPANALDSSGAGSRREGISIFSRSRVHAQTIMSLKVFLVSL